MIQLILHYLPKFPILFIANPTNNGYKITSAGNLPMGEYKANKKDLPLKVKI